MNSRLEAMRNLSPRGKIVPEEELEDTLPSYRPIPLGTIKLLLIICSLPALVWIVFQADDAIAQSGPYRFHVVGSLCCVELMWIVSAVRWFRPVQWWYRNVIGYTLSVQSHGVPDVSPRLGFIIEPEPYSTNKREPVIALALGGIRARSHLYDAHGHGMGNVWRVLDFHLEPELEKSWIRVADAHGNIQRLTFSKTFRLLDDILHKQLGTFSELIYRDRLGVLEEKPKERMLS